MERRQEFVKVYLTEKEKRKTEEKAQELNRSASSLLRDHLKNQILTGVSQ